MERSQVQELYERHGRSLAAYACRFLGDMELARDVVQETFVAAMDHDAEHVPRHPRAWLFAVTRHLALKALRGRRAVPLTQDPPAPAADGPEDRLARMYQAIRALPGPMRETLELKLEHGMSYQDIAAILEVPIGTVRSRLHNAVRKLRKELRDRPGPPA